MNEEHRQNNWTVLSRPLEERMHAALEAGRQIICSSTAAVTRRFLICKDCGFTHRCPACSVTLRYHRSDCRLKCHHCGHEEAAPDAARSAAAAR